MWGNFNFRDESCNRYEGELKYDSIFLTVFLGVTAAHCVLEKFATQEKIPRDVLQVFGAYDISSIYQPGTFTQSPWKIIIHNDWHPDTINFDADIALLLNEEEIPTTRLIKPICLWTSASAPVSNEGTVAGWGLESSGNYGTIPKEIKVPIHQNDDCLYGNPLLARLTTKRTLCAGARNGTGPCLGIFKFSGQVMNFL